MDQKSESTLWLSFRIDGQDYCVLCNYINSILIPDRIEMLPDTRKTLAGVTEYGQEMITVIEVREVFGKMNLKDCINQFCIMKDMHVEWIEDLERYVMKGGEFKKALDPHKCKFGLWYDSYTTDNARMKRLLNKITEPHEQLHQCGAEIVELRKSEGDHEAEILKRLVEAQQICHNEIIPLLDRLIDIYQSANRGVILVAGNRAHKVGLLVDEVRALISSDQASREILPEGIRHSPYLMGIIVSGSGDMHIEVNAVQLLKLADIEFETAEL